MFRLIFRLLLLVALLMGGLLLARNLLLRHYLRSEIERVTGLPCSVGSVNARLTSPVIEADAISIQNLPYGFHTPLALGIRSLSARYRPWALLRGRGILARLDVNLAVVNLVRAPDGSNNLHALRAHLLSAARADRSIEVEEFTLRVAKVRYVDESRGAPRIQTPAHRETHVWRDMRGEAALLKNAAAYLAEILAADPFETPAAPRTTPSPPSKRGAPPKENPRRPSPEI